jgi:hypothetical protein
MSSGFVHVVNQLFCCPLAPTYLGRVGCDRLAQQLGNGVEVGIGQVGGHLFATALLPD